MPIKKKRKASDEILGGRPFDDVLNEAVSRGSSTDAMTRQQLMIEQLAGRTLALNTQRARARTAAGHRPGPEGSITKIAKAMSNQQLQELAMGIRGADACAWESGDDDAADWVEQFLRTRANSIEGGTSEIQRNIVGERVLGLPREPDPFKGAAWRDVPRS